ncbi:DMT family transporter [Zavarzinia compransoris]|nr:DMT family transporter [Zavarzinia compransoris]TDP48027.1 EamA domain-containing membrane protein RarD [Zavarzinia compransoris]
MTSLAPAAPAVRNDMRLGVALVALSTLAWSSAGLFTRLLPHDAWTILFWRGLFGALTAYGYVALVERRSLVSAARAMGRQGVLFTVMMATGMIAYVVSLKLTTVAHVSIIYALLPFMSAGLAALFLGERLTAPTLVASTLALCGIGITVIQGFGEGDVIGDLLAVFMTLTMAVTIILLRQSKVRIEMMPAACIASLLGALVALPLASPFAVSAADLGWLALFGTTNMGLGLIVFTLGARLIPAGMSALIGALDAPLAPLWVWLAFGETPLPATVAGGLIVLVAVLGHILYENRRHTGG